MVARRCLLPVLVALALSVAAANAADAEAGEVEARGGALIVAVSGWFSVDGSGTVSCALAYDAAGNLTGTTLPSGNGHVETRSYDRAGRLTTLENLKSPTILSKHLWTLDAAGNPTKARTTRGSTDVYDVYEYDSRNRLTAGCYDLASTATNCAGATNAIGYAYDKVTNRTQEVRSGSVGNTGTIDSAYNAADQLTSTTKSGVSTTYTYDANGNQASAGSRSFSYDLAGRLASTTASSVKSSYGYDGDGRRVSSTVGGGADLRSVWDVLAPSGIAELALERDPSGNLVRRYLNGPTSVLNYTNTSASFWYHHDPLNTITDVTDASGTAQWRYEYEPYGAQRSATNVSGTAPENRLRFNGQHLDPETTFYHLRARQYDAVSGRFGALDPVENPVASAYDSAYAYVNGRPSALVDPLGLWGNPFGGLADMVGFYADESKDAAVDVAHQAADAYRGRGGGFDGVVAAVDAVNPVADAARSSKRTYDEAGGGAKGIVAVLDAATGARDAIAAARACANGNTTACAAIALSAVASLCGGPAAGRLASKATSKAATDALPRIAGGAPRFGSSRAARREAMRDAGLPTSATPSGRIQSEFGDQYLYSVPKPGGGSRTLAATNHPVDTRHGPHWEVGVVRPGSRDPSGRFHYYNRDPLTGRPKSQAPYGDG